MSLEFRHIAHAYGEVAALHDVSFIAPTGQITCLLGSSGCGKSTLLNLAAGLLEVQSGEVLVAGEALAGNGLHPAPEDRPIGLVFQDGALFPHMTIAQNVGFGLAKSERASVENWLASVGLGGMGARYPHELSGGQQQRAALARAMAPGPQVLLMDEPFASVDIVLRRSLRRECRRLLHEAGTTCVLVTHDPEEALDIADHIAVMDKGTIVQFGSPQHLHENPATAAVGAIFGGAQIIRAVREADGLRTAFGIWPLEAASGDLPAGVSLDLLAHSTELECHADPEGLFVRDAHLRSDRTRLVLANETGDEITVETETAINPGVRYRLVPRARSLRAFSRN